MINIIIPWQMNIDALNIAWVIKCKIAISGRCLPILIVIIPSCDIVDSAIVFLGSSDIIAFVEARAVVVTPIMNNVFVIRGVCFTVLYSRNVRMIPAVTNVEECTSADTGVGAAIASGNQR